MGRGTKKSKYIPPQWATPIKDDNYVPLYHTMLNSLAWNSLRTSSKQVYVILREQHKGFGDTVKCPYKTFNAKGLHNTTISKAIKELEEKGFIKVERGALQTGNLYRDPTEYRFLNKWVDFTT